jgi:predicted nuclease of predicted toxin-antitoxin system
MQFLADECLIGSIVQRLRRDGHDVTALPKVLLGSTDVKVLAHSYVEGRILLTHDYDFGDLAFRVGEPAAGIVIVDVDSFVGTFENLAVDVAERLAGLGDALLGRLTVLESARTRQRDLPSVDSRD